MFSANSNPQPVDCRLVTGAVDLLTMLDGALGQLLTSVLNSLLNFAIHSLPCECLALIFVSGWLSRRNDDGDGTLGS